MGRVTVRSPNTLQRAAALTCAALISLTTAISTAAAQPSPSPTPTDSPSATSPSPTPDEQPDLPAVPAEPTPEETAPPAADIPAPGTEVAEEHTHDFTDHLDNVEPVPLDSKPAPVTVLAGNSGLKPHPEVAFSGSRQIGHGWPQSGVIAAGDWNRNGLDDMMIIRSDGTLWYYPAASKYGFKRATRIGHGWHNFDLVIGGIDWNGDGRVDLIGRHKNGHLRAYFGNGSGGFSGAKEIGWNWQAMKAIVPLPRSVYGKPGLAAVGNDGVLSIYASNGKGTFTRSYRIGGGWHAMQQIAPAGDWNGSGRTDLLAIDANEYLRLYQADSSGTSFSGYRIGYGWGNASHLSSANLAGIDGHVRAVFPNGRLLDYSVRVKKTPTDSVQPGAQIPWTGKGWTYVAPGHAAGSGLGSTVTYRVEVEAGLPIYTDVFAKQVHQILNDKRGWRRNFTRVPSGGDMRLVLASPALVDRLCAPLDTNGYTSCSIGNYVVINARRWAYNAQPFYDAGGSLTQYRQYVINHETGHYLGHGHLQCPGAGRLAPVMQQQTLFVKPCRPNGWPNP